jgi:hypothetical protein
MYIEAVGGVYHTIAPNTVPYLSFFELKSRGTEPSRFS